MKEQIQSFLDLILSNKLVINARARLHPHKLILIKNSPVAVRVGEQERLINWHVPAPLVHSARQFVLLLLASDTSIRRARIWRLVAAMNYTAPLRFLCSLRENRLYISY